MGPRHVTLYDDVSMTTETEAEKVFKAAKRVYRDVKDWLTQNYPQLVKGLI